MDRKKRYCPFCGDKTNALDCDICGRKTKAIGQHIHEKEINIVEDRELDQQLNFDHIPQHTQKKESQKKELPYFRSGKGYEKEFAVSSELINKIMPAIVVIVIIVIAIGVIMENDTSFDDSIVEEKITYEDDAMNVICKVDKNGSAWVENPSDLFANVDVMDEDGNIIHLMNVLPYTRSYDIMEQRFKTCEVIQTSAFRFDFSKPEVAYHVEKRNLSYEFYLPWDVSHDQIYEVMKYNIPIIMKANEGNEEFYIYLGDQMSYEVEVEMSHQYTLRFHENRNASYLEDLEFDLS